jgi:hypothetical protein
MRKRSPWYSFLYVLLGAHGTFWLWVVTAIALWWTWHGAVLSMVNRYPEPRAASDAAAAHGLRRWVAVPGVRVRLDAALLLREDGADVPPTEVLIDEDDPSAQFWRVTRAVADADAGPLGTHIAKAAASLSEMALAGAVAGKRDARKALETRRLRLQTKRAELLPRPGAALILLLDGAAPIGSDVPVPAPVDAEDTEAYDRLVSTWRDVVRSHVDVAVTQGLLDDAPSKLIERLANDPGVRAGRTALKVNRTPNDLELYVFCGAALVFVFLATGLWGIVGGQPAAPDPGASSMP